MVKCYRDVHYCSHNVFFHATNGAQQSQKVMALMEMDVKEALHWFSTRSSDHLSRVLLSL